MHVGAVAPGRMRQDAAAYGTKVQYDPLHRRLVLSRENFEVRSVAALGITAAAWTYVAAFLTSLAYFLWYLLPLLLGNRRSDE